MGGFYARHLMSTILRLGGPPKAWDSRNHPSKQKGRRPRGPIWQQRNMAA